MGAAIFIYFVLQMSDKITNERQEKSKKTQLSGGVRCRLVFHESQKYYREEN